MSRVKITLYIILLTTNMSMWHCIRLWAGNQKNESWWNSHYIWYSRNTTF